MLKRCLALIGAVCLLLAAGWWFVVNDRTQGTDRRLEAGSKFGDRPKAWVEPDQRTVLISTVGGACDERVRVKVHEASDTVKIAITVHRSTGTCTDIGYSWGHKILLRSPLGTRKLVGIDDVAYDRADKRPVESSRAGNHEVPVEIKFEE